MLEKERFLAIKKLARDIRKDNRELFDKLEDESIETAVKEKNDFIDNVINNMASAFSDGEQGREEKQIFRANILIPDDDEFYNNYSKDKNIRNLMNKYAVNIEDIMSKITELNIYSNYIKEFASEPEEKEETNFVDEMVKITPKEAENLLDEIDSLSNNLDDLDFSVKEETVVEETKPVIEEKEPEIEEEEIVTPKPEPKKVEKPKAPKPKQETKPHKETPKPNDSLISDDFLGDSFENINNAISGFVTDYNTLRKDIKVKEASIKSLETKVQNLTNENNKAKEKNIELRENVASLKTDNANLREENVKLSKRMKVLEDKLYKSAALLKKVYNGIKD